jgi:hypothetical protein
LPAPEGRAGGTRFSPSRRRLSPQPSARSMLPELLLADAAKAAIERPSPPLEDLRSAIAAAAASLGAGTCKLRAVLPAVSDVILRVCPSRWLRRSAPTSLAGASRQAPGRTAPVTRPVAAGLLPHASPVALAAHAVPYCADTASVARRGRRSVANGGSPTSPSVPESAAKTQDFAFLAGKCHRNAKALTMEVLYQLS